MTPTTRDQWEEGFKYLASTSGGKVKTQSHDSVFSEITKAIRWTLDSIDYSGAVSRRSLAGMRGEFHCKSAPYGWVHANGQELSRTTDDALWQFAQNSGLLVAQSTKDSDNVAYAMYWGDGDGSSTFTIPNWHLGHFARGNPTDVNIGDTQGDTIRNITGVVDTNYNTFNEKVTGAFELGPIDTESNISISGNVSTNEGTAKFDASLVVPTSSENRPKTGNILVCLYRGKED